MNRTEKYRADGQAAINSLREFLYYVISNPGEFNARADLVKALGSQGDMHLLVYLRALKRLKSFELKPFQHCQPGLPLLQRN